jgi:NAD(P)-dependent dehydrogenase (short-subunit alcohol dehydrogenase family)
VTRTVLVTGASRGIGAEAARALAADGADVIAHYGSHRAGAEEAVAGLPDDRKLLLQASMSEQGAARALWRDALAWRGRVDVLVANAAIAPETPFEGTDEEWDAGWDATLRVNVLEPVSLIREAVNHFREHGGGIVITLSSWSAQQGSAISSLPAYAAEGVLAYVVAPGIVRTRMSEISATARGGIDAVNAFLAMGEMVPPEEVGELIAFLASGRCRHLSGATIDVNGATYVR